MKLVVSLKSGIIALTSIFDLEPKPPEFDTVMLAKSQDIFLISLKLLMPGIEEVQLAQESPTNLLLDLEEVARNHKINSVKTLIATLIETLASKAEFFLTSLTLLPIHIIHKNLHLSVAEDLFVSAHIKKFGLERLVILGHNELDLLGLVCSSLMILTNIAHVTPRRTDLM